MINARVVRLGIPNSFRHPCIFIVIDVLADESAETGVTMVDEVLNIGKRANIGIGVLAGVVVNVVLVETRVVAVTVIWLEVLIILV